MRKDDPVYNSLSSVFLIFNFSKSCVFSKTVGSISNDFEKITTDDKGHMSAKFSNSVSSVFVIFNLFHADIQVVHNFYVIA